MFLALLSTITITEISPPAGGAGIAEMKSILSGLLLHQYLSLKCLLSKILSITFAYAAGLPVGINRKRKMNQNRNEEIQKKKIIFY